MTRIPDDVIEKLEAAIRWIIGVQGKGLGAVHDAMRAHGYKISEARISKEAYRIGIKPPMGRPPGGPGYGGRPSVGPGLGKKHSKNRKKVWELREEGLAVAEIGRRLGITRQAVERLLKTPPDATSDEAEEKKTAR